MTAASGAGLQKEQLANTLTGILLKVASVAIFVGMSSCIKLAGDLPAGEIVFFRSFFAVIPVLAVFAWRGQLRSALATSHPLSHIARGMVGVAAMGLSFFALTRLPLPEAITLNYAQPLLVVVFSVICLGETIHIYRWSAVIVGLIGVLIISWPKLTLFSTGAGFSDQEAVGVVAALVSAAVSAVAMILVRRLVRTEKSTTIVLWFSLTASAIALLTIPFGWKQPTIEQATLLIAAGFCGGIAQILMTEAYRHAEASTVAPFEYTSMILSIISGYLLFADLPTIHTLIGGTIVVGAGLFIVWRERQLGIKRGAARKLTPPV
ncbi:DMT family transporter [Mesorhizobium sp. BAC0120]|uniref:DMT family transporter n=1 Tax=Mesorhizobium sp. BAC0120 TaxID=3090670 RepID=UPI00298CCC43|nr:DMT family transporter [Mesorhizobium sp. BAC0120]MDW6021146.1 DMT family transporter [Mesorhizobium sp. BAC0120]